LEQGFRPQILATDISTQVLATGKQGIYPISRTARTPHHILKKYFQKGHGKWDGYVRLKGEVKEIVTFRRFNLLTDFAPSEAFDVIFCRNVMIYFDAVARSKVIEKLHGALKENGYLIIGGAESLSGLAHKYQYVCPSIYSKQR
jgi:chemotaxis protein methyltransferase CheR